MTPSPLRNPNTIEAEIVERQAKALVPQVEDSAGVGIVPGIDMTTNEAGHYVLAPKGEIKADTYLDARDSIGSEATPSARALRAARAMVDEAWPEEL